MQEKAKYLVIIDLDGASTAMLFTEQRVLVADFDSSSEEVPVMTRGLVPSSTANMPQWDQALAGCSHADRLQAQVYVLDV